MSKPEEIAGTQGVTVRKVTVPEHRDSRGRTTLSDEVVASNEAKDQPADGPITFITPETGTAFALEVTRAETPNESVTVAIPDLPSHRRPTNNVSASPVLPNNGVCVVHDQFSGDGHASKVKVNGTDVPVLAESQDLIVFKAGTVAKAGENQYTITDNGVAKTYRLTVPSVSISASQTTLKQGQSAKFQVTVSDVGGIPEGSWSSTGEEAYGAATKGGGAARTSRKGYILLTIKNDSPDTTAIAGGNLITVPVYQNDLTQGSYTYNGTITAQQPGVFQIEAGISTRLAEAGPIAIAKWKPPVLSQPPAAKIPPPHGPIGRTTSRSEANPTASPGEGGLVFQSRERLRATPTETPVQQGDWGPPMQTTYPGPVQADIDMDTNRDGDITDGSVRDVKHFDDDPDGQGEVYPGIILIRDADGVYDPGQRDPARRRELIVRELINAAQGTPTELLRSSDSILLYNRQFPTKKPEGDLFGLHDTITVAPSDYYHRYWVQGGKEPSDHPRDEWLIACPPGTPFRRPGENTRPIVPPGCDVIYFTVIWADISARTSGELDKDPVYDKWGRVDKVSKNLKLGIQRNNPGAADGGVVSMHANIELRAKLSPPLERHTFDDKITTNLRNPPCPDDTSGSTKADFGFTFRRIATSRWYHWDYLKGSFDDKPDDSCPEFEDADPDRDPAELAPAPSAATRRAVRTVIVDYDGPGLAGWAASPSGDVYVVSGKDQDGFDFNRDNMKQYVVFFNFKGKGERCSRILTWGDTFDSGWSYQDSRVSVLYPPNKGGAGNKVVVEEFPYLFLRVPTAQVDSVATVDGTQQFKAGTTTTLKVTGKDLVGNYVMKNLKTGAIRQGRHVRVKETDPGDHFSDATEAKVDFILDDGTWEFYIENQNPSENPHARREKERLEFDSNHFGTIKVVP